MAMGKVWQRLEVGDVVDVVAPASACKPHELAAGVRYLKSLGLVPHVPKDILRPQSLNFSNSDERRLLHLKDALLNSKSKAIWCLRGGYGALKLIPDLEKLKRPSHCKVLLGFSDITTLHGFLNQKWGWPTLHSPVLTRMGGANARASEKRELQQMLFGRRAVTEFTGLLPLNSSARTQKTVRGKVRGGNIAVLQSSYGTRQQFDGRGHMIFLEDIGEKPHRVDRMLEQMTQAGTFQHAKAILFGQFDLENRKDLNLIWNDVIPRFAKQQKIPVLKGLRVGHGKNQHTLPLNTLATLSLGPRGSKLSVEVGFR